MGVLRKYLFILISVLCSLRESDTDSNCLKRLNERVVRIRNISVGPEAYRMRCHRPVHRPMHRIISRIYESIESVDSNEYLSVRAETNPRALSPC